MRVPLTFVFVLFAVSGAFSQRVSFNDATNSNIRSQIFDAPYGFLKLRCNVNPSIKTVSLSISNVDQKHTALIPVQNGLVEHDVRFDKTGIYRYALRDAQTLIDSGEIEIEVNQNAEPVFTFVDDNDDEGYDNPDPQSDPYNPMYYIASQISFSDRTDESGNPVATADEFNMNGNEATVNIIVENTKPLATSGIAVDVYRMQGKTPKFFDVRHYEVDMESNTASLPYTFKKPGTYLFKVFNDDDVWIENGTITVKR